MKLQPAQQYNLKVKKDFSYELKSDESTCKFSAPATIRGVAKLYTLSQGNTLLYVGIASQPMSSRINSGLKAKGKNGYHGYKWKTIRSNIILRIWTVKKGTTFISLAEMKAIEAEVAYICRNTSKQWPTHQNEIHFQQSGPEHRAIAEKIYFGAIKNNC